MWFCPILCNIIFHHQCRNRPIYAYLPILNYSEKLYCLTYHCYALSVFPPKLINWNTNTQCDGTIPFGKWWDHMDGTIMNGIVDYKRNIKALLALCLWGYKDKIDACESGSEFLPDTISARSLVLDFLASRIVRNKCCCLSHPPMVFLSQPE